MDKAKICENIDTMNKLIPMTIDIVGAYMDEAYKHADTDELYAIMGTQATYLHNIATFVLNNADVKTIDVAKLVALIERMDKVVNIARDNLGITDDEEEETEDDDDDVSDEMINEFAKECKLNKTETEVLRKIVKGKGNPTNMTKKDEETALKMAGKIEKAGKELGF